MYKMILSDGTTVEFSGMNGTNFIVPDKKEIDTSIFTDSNLKSVIVVTEDGNEIECNNLSFTQQQKQLNGEYYICFYEKSDQEIKNETLEKAITQLMEIEVASGNLLVNEIEDDTIRNAVEAYALNAGIKENL